MVLICRFECVKYGVEVFYLSQLKGLIEKCIIAFCLQLHFKIEFNFQPQTKIT